MESLINKAQSKVMHYLSTPGGTVASRLYDRVPSDSSDTAGAKHSSGETESVRKITPKLHKRSQSVGSIDMADLDLNAGGTPSALPYLQQSAEKSKTKGEYNIDNDSSPNKKGKRFSKWMRVKKVFSAKSEQSKSLDAGTVEQLVRVNSKHPKRGKPARLPHIIAREDRSKSVPHIEVPASPHSTQSEPHEFPDDENYLYEELGNLEPQSSSTPSTDGYPTLRSSRSAIDVPATELERNFARDHNSGSFSDSEDGHKHQLLKVRELRRRKSSPNLALRQEATPDEPFRRDSIARVNRSSSFKDYENKPIREKSPASPPPTSESKKNRSPWNRVKDIIHTRKDSLKKKNVRPRLVSGGENANDADGEISPDSSSWEGKVQVEQESATDGPDQFASPRLKRHNTSKVNVVVIR